jgi:hypothetical protein
MTDTYYCSNRQVINLLEAPHPFLIDISIRRVTGILHIATPFNYCMETLTQERLPIKDIITIP